MDTAQVRERTEKIRMTVDRLAHEIMSSEARGDLSGKARRDLLKRLEKERLELRIHARYLTELEERQHEHLASRRKGPSPAEIEARRTTLKKGVEAFQSGSDQLKEALARILSHAPAFDAQIYFGLTLCVIDQRMMAAETRATLQRLARLMTPAA